MRLSKFSDDMHQLVELLGGVEASPFVWGPEHRVTRELPQIMPHVKLVKSRSKLMRPADHPSFRRIVNGVETVYRKGEITPRQFRLLLSVYPEIDHAVVDYRRGQAVAEAQIAALQAVGWEKVGRSSARGTKGPVPNLNRAPVASPVKNG